MPIPLGAIAGIAGIVTPILKGLGILKDPEMELKFLSELHKQEAQLMDAVNKSMQAEARSDSWMQRSWRPIVGFTFSATIINNYILLPYLAPFGVLPIQIPTELWAAMLAVLGVAAYTRGREKEKRVEADREEAITRRHQARNDATSDSLSTTAG